MTPANAPVNLADGLSKDAEVVRNCLLSVSLAKTLPYRPNVFVSKFGAVVPLAFASAMLGYVLAVLSTRTPIQVLKGVVERVAVSVTGFSPVRPWPDKSAEHEVVNIETIAAPKANGEPRITDFASAFELVGGELSPYVSYTPSVVAATPNCAVRANPVPIESRYFFVFDHASIVSNKGPLCCS